MEIRKFENVEGVEGLQDWYIVNQWANTQHGFKHVSTLIHYNSEVCTDKCCYLNRTWECYRYQTSMRCVVNKYIKEIKDRIIYYYKQDNNVTRLTKKHKDAIKKLENDDKRLVQLKEIYKQLENSH